MTNNVGGKLQGLAIFICIVSIIACVIGGIAMIHNGAVLQESYYTRDAGKQAVIYGWVLLIVGPIASWIGSWTLTALGQATENSETLLKEVGELKYEIHKMKEEMDKVKSSQGNQQSPIQSKDTSFVLPPL